MINWKKVGEKISSGAKAVGRAIGGAVGYLFGSKNSRRLSSEYTNKR